MEEQSTSGDHPPTSSLEECLYKGRLRSGQNKPNARALAEKEMHQKSDKHDWRWSSSWENLVNSFDSSEHVTDPFKWMTKEHSLLEAAEGAQQRLRDEKKKQKLGSFTFERKVKLSKLDHCNHKQRAIKDRASDRVKFHLNTPFYSQDSMESEGLRGAHKTPKVKTLGELRKHRVQQDRQQMANLVGMNQKGADRYHCGRSSFEKDLRTLNRIVD